MYQPRRMHIDKPEFSMTGQAASLHYQLRAGFSAEEAQGVIDAPDYIATGAVLNCGWVQGTSVPRQGCLS